MNKSLSHHANHAYSSQILRQAMKNWGARIGLFWVLVLVFFAVFSPLLANSIPLVVSQSGNISFPFARYLTVEDSLFFGGFLIFLGLMLSPLKRSIPLFTVVFLSLLFIIAIVANYWISPPKLIIYDDFRLPHVIQSYDWFIQAPIPFSPSDYMRDINDPPLLAPLESPLLTHWMGTEENGADVLSRMIHASRIALVIGFIATGIALLIGTVVGGLMGYFSGWVDMLGMRLVEVFEAIPTLFLLLTFIAFFGRSIYIMMIIIGVTSWAGYARYIRAEFLTLRKQDYVQAAIASGLSLPTILFKHMLPNGIAPLLVSASFGVASAILAEAVLSFLGLGLVGEPSWGQMLNQSIISSTFNWWMAIFPGLAIFMTVFAYNLIGEALRDAIDPQLNKQ